MGVGSFSFEALLHTLPSFWLLLIFLIALFVLVKSADVIIAEAVYLSKRWGLSKAIIGATVVSIGTTLPEVCVSVWAAIKGQSSIALGNAIGSVICDTGLVLGLACVLGKVPSEYKNITRQCWVQFLSACGLVAICFFTREGGLGRLPQGAGIIFLFALCLYLYKSISWSSPLAEEEDFDQMGKGFEGKNNIWLGISLGCSFLFLALASEVLIASISILALRAYVPESIIAVSLVALGTSLPELTTAIRSVRRGHGDLALGNVIGADILNILFVSGAAAAVSSQGLMVDRIFYSRMFPIMLILVFMVRLSIRKNTKELSKTLGWLLLFIYVGFTVLNFLTVLK